MRGESLQESVQGSVGRGALGDWRLHNWQRVRSLRGPDLPRMATGHLEQVGPHAESSQLTVESDPKREVRAILRADANEECQRARRLQSAGRRHIHCWAVRAPVSSTGRANAEDRTVVRHKVAAQTEHGVEDIWMVQRDVSSGEGPRPVAGDGANGGLGAVARE